MRNQFNIEIPAQLEVECGKYENSLKKWKYCKVDSFGMVEEVYCKRCSVRIMGSRAWGDPEVTQSKDEKNTVVVRQNVRIMPFDNYSMSIFKMDDNSKHLTVTCKACAIAIQHSGPAELEALYMCDIYSLAETAASDRDIEVVTKLHNRKPVEVL